jgi:O-antigen ligase
MASTTATASAPVTLARENVREREGSPVFSIARVLLVATLFAAPLAFGAVQTWAWAALAVTGVVLLILWTIGNVQQGAVVVHWSPLYLPAGLFVALGGVQLAAHLTLDPYATRQSLIKLTTDLIFFFLAGQLWAGAPGKTWEKLGFGVTLYAFFLSLFAIIQFFSSPIGVIYWHAKTAGWAFGPYVNRNHYGGLMEMLIPLAAAYALSRPSGSPGKSLLAFGVLVPVVSTLLSASRGAFMALLAETAILGVILFRQRHVSARKNLAVPMAVAVALAAALFFWAAPRWIPKRLETVAGLAHAPEVTLQQRWTVWKDSLGMIRDHPWLGTGLGSFIVAFPRYQSFASDLLWDHAHNDYVEAMSETGLAGTLLIAAGLGLFFREGFGDLDKKLRHPAGWIQVGAALGVCGLLVHSFSDFNLHIPANAAWFGVCAGLVSAQAFDGWRERSCGSARQSNE